MKRLAPIMLKLLFQKEKELVFMLSDEGKAGAMMAIVQTHEIWKRESFANKIKSLLTLRWNPGKSFLYPIVKQTFMNDVFGQENDFGEELFKLSIWHHAQPWNLIYLTDFDKVRSQGLVSAKVFRSAWAYQ